MVRAVSRDVGRDLGAQRERVFGGEVHASQGVGRANVGDKGFDSGDFESVRVLVARDVGEGWNEDRRAVLQRETTRNARCPLEAAGDERIDERPQFAQVACAVGSGVERAAGFEHAMDLRHSFRQVGDVVEHVVGDDGVEGRGVKGECLGIRDLERKRSPGCGEVASHSFDHSRREVHERDLPSGGQAIEVLHPQICRPASDFEDTGGGGHIEVVEDPAEPRIHVGTEARVQLDARIEIRVVLVLFGEHILF